MTAPSPSRVPAQLVLHGGTVLVDAHSAPLDADVVVVDGRVAEVSPRPSGATRPGGGDGDVEVLDVTGSVVMPGLVQAHGHAYAHLARQPWADDWLEPWMPRAMAAWSRSAPGDVTLSIQLAALDAMRHGVTSFVDHHTLGHDRAAVAVDAWAGTGLRSWLAVQGGDRSLAEWADDADAQMVEQADPFTTRSREQVVDAVEAAIAAARQQPLVQVLVGPSAPERCSSGLLADLADLACLHSLGVHTHLLEVPSQLTVGDQLARLDRVGLLTARTSVAHAVHLSSHDIDRLATAGATVVHNPLSNLALGCSGVCDVAALTSRGVTVAVGCDGRNCGGSTDPLEAARLAITLGRGTTDSSEWLGLHRAFEMATSAAGRSLGEPQLGRLVTGGPADLVVVDPVGAGWVADDLVAEAVVGGLAGAVRHLVVAGRTVVRDGRCVTLDAAAVHAAARERLPELTDPDLRRQVESRLVEPLRSRRRAAESLVPSIKPTPLTSGVTR